MRGQVYTRLKNRRYALSFTERQETVAESKPVRAQGELLEGLLAGHVEDAARRAGEKSARRCIRIGTALP